MSKIKRKKRRLPRRGVKSHRVSDETNALYASDFVMLGEDYLVDDRIREMDEKTLDVQKDKWVPFMTKGLSFLNGLLALLENSSTLRSIIRQKCTLVFSGGFLISKGSMGLFAMLKKALGIVDPKDKVVVEINDFLKDINLDSESVVDVGKKVLDNFLSFGNGFVEMVRGSDEEGSFFYVNHWDVTKCMIKVERVKGNKIIRPRAVGYNDYWSTDVSGSKATEVYVYPKWKKMDDGTERSIIHLKDYAAGYKYWGAPYWLPVKRFVELEYRTVLHNVFKMVNGYFPSSLIQFFGAKTPDEGKEIIRKAKQAFTGPGNNAKIFFQVLSDERYKAHVQLLEDKSEGSFLELIKLSVQMIVTGLGWSTSVIGVETSGKLGNNQQVKLEFERVNNMSVNPLREYMASKFLSVVLAEASYFLDKKWNGYNVSFGNSSIYSLQTEVDVNQVLSVPERRELLGFDKVPDDDQFLNQNNSTDGSRN